MYRFATKVRYTETDINGKLNLKSIVNLFQDCTNFHTRAIGAGQAYYESIHRMWVLSSWQIVVDEYPDMGDDIVVTTTPYEFTAMFGMRNFTLECPDGTILARANSVWVLMDTEKGKPCRVTQEDINIFGIGEKLDMDYASRKIEVSGQVQEQEPIRVRHYHLDSNRHMNNGWYVQIAMEYVPDDFYIRQLRAEYKISAKEGNWIVPCCARSENQVLVELREQGSGQVFAVVSFEGGAS